MSVTINVNGQLVLDQSPGIQDDDVAVAKVGNDLVGGLDQDFLNYLNTLGLSGNQLNFADKVEGASQDGLVTVDITDGETVGKLFFSDASGNDFDGDLVPGVTTLSGAPLFFWSAQNGKVVLVKTGGGEVVAAFYIESTDATNTEAFVQSITFRPLLHTDPNNPDDSLDFSDVLRVSAVITQDIGDDILVDDDAPSIVVTSDSVQLTVDETTLAADDTQNFAAEFTGDIGTDDESGGTTYSLDTIPGASGLVDTLSGENVILSKQGLTIVGKTELGGDTVFVVSVDAAGNVSLDQQRAVRHDPDLGPDQSTTLAADNLITLTATIIDADGDQDSAVLDIGQNLNFEDDAPSITSVGTQPNITLDETTFGSNTGNFAPNFAPVFGNDGSGGVTYALGVTAGTIPGLIDSVTGGTIDLQMNGGVAEGRTTVGGLLVFTVSVDAAGVVTFTQARAITHADAGNPDDSRALGAADLISLTATASDGDADTAQATIGIGDNLFVEDDGPVVTVPVDYPGADTSLHVGNAAGQSNTGSFGYNIGNDAHNAAFYAGGGSDFTSMALTGSTSGTGAFLSSNVALFSEDADSAVFNWNVTFDTDPITAGNQVGTASGTLTFDKDADTFAIGVNDPFEGFSFSVLHTNELLRKAPPGNTGHPELVVTELDVNNGTTDQNGFYVQFTANSNPNGSPFGFALNPSGGDGPPQAGNTAYNTGEFVASNFEDWVSATQTTNGVAGDTIQKGELLTLRFFNENIMGDVNPGAPGGGTEKIVPTDHVDAVALKFDGIGNSEDLMMVLNLIDTVTGNTTTKAIRVDNVDIIKGPGGVPAPYNSEFSLDNNDGLVIIEKNDYNFAGENYEIQGVQIMQSGNGLTGNAINFNGLTGVNGGSSGTQAWDATDNDVLKITDIGFIETTTGGQDASLDFAFNIADSDQDLLGVQHINALISNGFII